MMEKEAMEKIRSMMKRQNTTIRQLREVAKGCKRDIWFSLRKPERNIEINVSRGTVKKTLKGR